MVIFFAVPLIIIMKTKHLKKKKQHLNCLNYNMLEIEIARLRHLRTIISVIINENQEQL